MVNKYHMGMLGMTQTIEQRHDKCDMLEDSLKANVDGIYVVNKVQYKNILAMYSS